MAEHEKTHDDADTPIRVKLLAKHRYPDPVVWLRQLPGGGPSWGRCTFTLDADSRDYDWLVVYDELPRQGEALACPRGHTLLVTVEPASIKVYGSAYLRQFGAVLTSQEPWALDHPGVIRSMPSLQWFYGWPMGEREMPYRTYDQIKAAEPDKTGDVSAVSSSKAMGHTLHALRYAFVQRLAEAMPEVDLFGRGVRPVDDKAEALDGYRYHVAIENHLAPHHITEKLTDPLLAGCLPFYFGAPNAADYFPKDSFIPIDIRKPDQAIRTIRDAVAGDVYGRRVGAVAEAKRRVLDEYNLFAVLARHIERLDTGRRGGEGAKLVNRRVLRNRNPIGAVGYLLERYRVQARVRRGQRA